MRTNESSNKETRTVHIYSTLPVRRVRGYASHTFELARVYTTVNSPALPPPFPYPFHRDRSARHWCARVLVAYVCACLWRVRGACARAEITHVLCRPRGHSETPFSVLRDALGPRARQSEIRRGRKPRTVPARTTIRT